MAVKKPGTLLASLAYLVRAYAQFGQSVVHVHLNAINSELYV